MKYLSLALLPLLVVGCTNTPTAVPDLEAGPTFNASDDHEAIVRVFDGYAVLFDAEGGIIVAPCQGLDVFTQSATNMVTAEAHCWTPNPTGRAVVYTQDKNPIGPLCGSIPDPDGIRIRLCNLREVVAANGNILLHMWGTPIYP